MRLSTRDTPASGPTPRRADLIMLRRAVLRHHRPDAWCVQRPATLVLRIARPWAGGGKLALRTARPWAGGGGLVAAAGAAVAAAVIADEWSTVATCDGASNSTLHDDYELGAMLGEGHFATVQLGKSRKTGKQVAIKTIPKSKQNADSIRHEIAVLRRVSLHKRVASLEDFYEDAHSFHVVMEYVRGGEVLDHLMEHGAYSEREAATLISEARPTHTTRNPARARCL
jgi:hypothetical protein